MEDGCLVGRSAARNHLFSTRGDYEDFQLKAEVSINKYGNSGILFRSNFGLNRLGAFPDAYEAQILNSYPKPDVPLTGSLLRFSPIQRQLVKPDKCFTLEIFAKENRIIIKVNGNVAVDFPDRDHTYRKGHLVLQAMSDEVVNDTTIVRFRKIEIKELPAKNPVSPEANRTEAKSKPSGSTQRAKRIGRWEMQWNVKNFREYVAQLRGLGVILAVPVGEGTNGPEYEIVRDLSARPAKPIKEEIKEIQRKEFWIDDKPDSVQGVMSVLGLRLHPSHFLAIFTEEAEKKLLHLEIDYLKQRHPGRSEDDIALTTFTVKLKDGEYVPEVVKQRLK